METLTENQLNPSAIMQIGMGFWASKTLLTAVNMGLFTQLAQGALTGEEIRAKLNLHNRGTYDFLDTLVALGFLNREGLKENATYSATPETELFLDRNKPSYVGGMLEMSNNRLYKYWDNLEEGLKTGEPQNEAKTGEKPLFEAIYADRDKTKDFLAAMGGIQMGNFITLATQFDFLGYQTHCDIGGAGGHLSAQIAINNPSIKSISFDLPMATPIATEHLEAMGVADRVTAVSGDFFQDEFPKVDVITMGNVLHDWGTEDKKMLIKKAYNALPKGGVLIVIENIIDDNRNQNAFGLMMSLNMLIETPEGFDFTMADFTEWAQEAGFNKITSMPLTGPTSAAIAIK